MDAATPGGDSSLNVEKGEDEEGKPGRQGEDLSGEGTSGNKDSLERKITPPFVEDTNCSAEDQKDADCDANKFSCDSQTLSSDALEGTNMSCKAPSCEARTSQGRTSTNFDSEPECRGDDGAPGSGPNQLRFFITKCYPLKVRILTPNSHDSPI